MDDEKYIQMKASHILGHELNLENPKSFNDKLNWLKLHDRNPEYTLMVDKIEAKKWVAGKIGKEYVIPALGVWDKVEDIDPSSLPNTFVLKCNHESKVHICRNGIITEDAKKDLKKHLKNNNYYRLREWPFKDIERRVFAEEFIPSIGGEDTIEYKLTCCNGKVKMITICSGPAHVENERRFNDHYTPNWDKLDFYAIYKNTGKDWKKPEFMDKMIELSEILAVEIPTVRVDWYYHEGRIYFGEMTFYTWGGFIPYVPQTFDDVMGSWVTLPKLK